MGENSIRDTVGEEAGQHGATVGDTYGEEEQATCGTTDVSDGGHHQTHDDERDEEFQEGRKHGVERREDSHEPLGQEATKEHAKGDGDDDAGEEGKLIQVKSEKGKGKNEILLIQVSQASLVSEVKEVKEVMWPWPQKLKTIVL